MVILSALGLGVFLMLSKGYTILSMLGVSVVEKPLIQNSNSMVDNKQNYNNMFDNTYFYMEDRIDWLYPDRVQGLQQLSSVAAADAQADIMIQLAVVRDTYNEQNPNQQLAELLYYAKQIYVFKESHSGEIIVFVNMYPFDETDDSSTHPTGLRFVLDGGSAYWQLWLNLTTGEVIDLNVNKES